MLQDSISINAIESSQDIKLDHHQPERRTVPPQKAQHEKVQLEIPEETDEPAIDDEKLQKAIQDINIKLQDDHKHVEVSIHEATKNLVIKVIDEDTNEIIKQYPAQKLLDYAEGLLKSIGILDERG